jgi:predicted amidohydrolase YtcJ
VQGSVTAATQLFFNADVRVMDDRSTRADAIAWREGRVLAVGTRSEVERLAGAGAETVDLGGVTVLPGFIDAHHHPSLAALYGGLVRLSPPAVTDIASLQAALARAAAELEPGRWLVALDWNEALLAEARPPTRQELDDAAPNHPVLAMHYSFHRAVANSCALELAGIGRDTPEPAGGIISRGRGGLPDGLLIERGISRLETLARASLVARDVEGFFARLAAHHRALAAAGITRVVDAAVPVDLLTLYREAARRGELLVPTVVMPVGAAGYLEPPWDALEGATSGTPLSDDSLTRDLLVVGPLKLIFDGAPTCAMCLSARQSIGVFFRSWAMAIRRRSLDPIRASMSVRPRFSADGKIRTGIALYPRADAAAIVRAASERGFSVATHAIGNEAIDLAVAAYEAAGPALQRPGAPRIEHGTFLDRALVARIAGLGCAVVTQPIFLTLPTFANAPSIPNLRAIPLRWLLDAGVAVAGSSDFPVCGFEPLDGIRAAVTRRARAASRTSTEEIHEPEQRIEIDEALALYTRTAAAVSGCADRCGELGVGKRADLVVLDRALRGMDTLAAAQVRATLIGGKVVFGSPAPHAA